MVAAAFVAAPAAPAQQQQQQAGRNARAVVAFVAVRPRQQQRRAFGRTTRSTRLVVASASPAAEGVGKLISKVEIPAFIPRADLIDQLVRWAVIEIQENGVANCGCPCKVRLAARLSPMGATPSAAAAACSLPAAALATCTPACHACIGHAEP